MAVGVSKTFQDRCEDLIRAAKAQGHGWRGTVASRWYAGLVTPTVDVYDTTSIAKAFDRSEPDKTVRDAFAKPAETQRVEIVSAQLQSSILGAMERDFRMRYRSRMRILAHQIARADGHGSDAGAIRQGVLRRIPQVAQQGAGNVD